MKTALTIAGSDCSGGAGLQADLKTFAAHGLFGMSVVVSVVAENTCQVAGIQHISPEIIEKQIDMVFEDIPPDTVKVGMLPTPSIMSAVAGKLAALRPPHLVIDPVMIAKNGCPLMEPEAIEAFIKVVLPLGGLLTPNIPEAERILGCAIKTPTEMAEAARAICRLGCDAVLVKGGHYDGEALDILFDGQQSYSFCAPRIPTKNTHGTGCTLSSAIAARLAEGLPLPEAVEKAKAYVTEAIRHSLPLGKGCGPTNHFYALYQQRLAEPKEGFYEDD